MANKGDEITTKFKVDISDLKQNITEANKNIKLANAQFKAASAGMDDWEKSSEGINAKLKQLNTVLTEQNKKLDAYKKEQQQLDKAYAENGKRADELKAKLEELASQGISKTSEEYKKYQKALSEVEKEQAANKAASDDLKATILNQQAAVNQTEKETRNYENTLSELESESSKAESATGKLTKEIDDQQDKLDKLKSKYADVVVQQGKSSTEAEELAKRIKELSGELKNNKDKLSDAEKAADEFDETLDDVGNTAENASGGFTIMKGALASLVADGIRKAVDALKDFVKETINVGSQFDSSMSQVAAVSGATNEELEALRDKAKEMGANTKFSASAAADAFNYMAMAGWKTESMLDGIDGVLNLAAASGEDLATTSDIVTDALTALGMSADDSAHFADVLAAASSNANTNVSLMGESFKYVAPVAGSMGASAEDLSIALGLMANSGIKGSQAGNSLKNALVNLTKPTVAQAEAMKKLGFISTETVQKIDFTKVEKAEKAVENATYSLDNAQIKLNDAISKYGENSSQAQIASNNYAKAQLKLISAQEELATEQAGFYDVIETGNTLMTDGKGNMRSLGEVMETLREKMGKVNVELTDSEGNARDFDDIMAELSTTTEGLAQAEQMQAAATIFGKQNMAGMLAIINASEDDYNKLTSAIYDCEGTAKDMADTMQDNLGGDLTQLGSKLEGVQIAIYEKFEPALRSGTKVLSKLLDAVNFVVKHSTEFIAGLAAMGAAVATYVAYTTAINVMKNGWMALTVVQKAAAAAQWLLNAAMSANPIGLIVAAIAALVAGFVVLWKKSEAFRSFWIGLWEKIKVAAAPAIKYIVDYFQMAWDNIKTVWNTVVAYFQMIWDNIKLVFSAVKSVFSGDFDEAWEAIKGIFKNVGNFFQEHVLNAIGKIFENIDESFTAHFGKAWEKVKETFAGVGEFFSGVWESISGFFTGIGEWFTEKFTAAKDGVTNAWATVATWFNDNVIIPIQNFFAPIVEWFSNLWSSVSETFRTTFEVIRQIAEGCWILIKTIWGVVSEWFNDNIIQPLTKFFTTVWDFIKNRAQTTWNGIKTIWTVVSNWFNEHIIKPITDFFKKMWDSIKTKASDTWNGIKTIWNVVETWFNNTVIQPVKDYFTGMWDKLKSGAKDAWEGIKSVFSKVSDWFKDKFTDAWTKVKDVFSTGGKIFDGIKEGIASTFTTVVNGIIGGINKVIAVPFNAINSALENIRDISIAGIEPFSGLISTISVPEIPLLATGGVLKKGQVGLLEGSGAEAVVPLEKNKYWIKKVADELKGQLSGMTAGLTGTAVNNSPVTNSNVNNFTQVINAPKTPSRIELYRQTKNLLALLKGGI